MHRGLRCGSAGAGATDAMRRLSCHTLGHSGRTCRGRQRCWCWCWSRSHVDGTAAVAPLTCDGTLEMSHFPRHRWRTEELSKKPAQEVARNFTARAHLSCSPAKDFQRLSSQTQSATKKATNLTRPLRLPQTLTPATRPKDCASSEKSPAPSCV